MVSHPIDLWDANVPKNKNFLWKNWFKALEDFFLKLSSRVIYQGTIIVVGIPYIVVDLTKETIQPYVLTLTSWHDMTSPVPVQSIAYWH
jgi:hypothetical protein